MNEMDVGLCVLLESGLYCLWSVLFLGITACVFVSGYILETSVSEYPGSYDLECMAVPRVVTVAVVVVELGTIMCDCYQCCLQKLSMSFAPKEEGHFLIPGRDRALHVCTARGSPEAHMCRIQAT